MPEEPLRIKKIEGERLVYLVESGSHRGDDWEEHAYRADLEANPILSSDGRKLWNGWCACPNFKHKQQKNVDLGHFSPCKHLKRLRDHVFDDLLSRIINESRTPRTTTIPAPSRQ